MRGGSTAGVGPRAGVWGAVGGPVTAAAERGGHSRLGISRRHASEARPEPEATGQHPRPQQGDQRRAARNPRPSLQTVAVLLSIHQPAAVFLSVRQPDPAHPSIRQPKPADQREER